VPASESVSRFRIKRTLDALASKFGRGTELVSLYVPPGRRIYEVTSELRKEYGTASNIKSRTTRKNVQDAIDRVMQRLKLFKEPPPTGLVVFSGAIPQNGPGTEKMETYVLVPPEPIHVYLYRCDDKFHLEPLQEIIREKETYGIIVIDGNEAVLATLRGRRVDILKEYTSGIGGKHRAGGQSARRFERIREAEVNKYFKRVGNHANELFMPIQDLKGLIVGGPGPTKYDFENGEHLHYTLKDKIVGTVDTAYVGENGVEEVVEKSPEILRGVRYLEEKKLVQRFLFEIGHETGKGVYGESEVRKYLREGVVETLLISEKVNLLHVVAKCRNCGYFEDKLLSPHEIPKYEQSLATTQCKKCLNMTMAIEDKNDLADEFIELAEKSEANIEIISSETEEGAQLLQGFGGIAAILRYKAQ